MSLYEVFCDAISEKGFVWTLIESFSFRNNNEFADKAFYKEYPVNQEAFTWSKFRLALARMITTAKRSTHVRATCNFNTEELKYRDYLRAKLHDIDVMRFNGRGACKKFTNLLASEDITVATARLSSSKQIIGMRILIRFTVQRKGVSLPANPQVQ